MLRTNLVALALALFAVAGMSACDHGGPDAADMEPYVIHVALQDGFVNEHVVLRLDGKEVFTSETVSTRFQIGLAEEIELDAQAPSELEFVMPGRNVSEVVTLETGEEQWVGASLVGDVLEVVVSDKPFRYA